MLIKKKTQDDFLHYSKMNNISYHENLLDMYHEYTVTMQKKEKKSLKQASFILCKM